MAQKIFHESRQDARSVLGMLAVQVERDLKTGASVVRSVTPVSAPAAPHTATTVFDDGRKSIHVGSEDRGQPFAEELGQILSVIDGVGIKVLLGEAGVTKNMAETKTETEDAVIAPEANVFSFPACHAISDEDNAEFDISSSYNERSKLGMENCVASMGNEPDKKEDRCTSGMHLGDVDSVVNEKFVEGPVTLLFLGYSDDTTDQCHNPDNHGGMLTVERVIITEEGEEHVLEPGSSPQEGKQSPEEMFQDVPLGGNGAGVKVQKEESYKVLHDSSPLNKAQEEATPKHKTCQCCSVM